MKSPVSPAQRRLVDALSSLKTLQDAGKSVLRSEEIERREREALLKAGFLQRVTKGWYIVSCPGDGPGDTTPWFVAMRDFIGAYCNERFGDQWCLAANYSLLLHAGATVLPTQVIVMTPLGSNSKLVLPANCTLLQYKSELPPKHQIVVREGLRVLTLPAALIRVSDAFFNTYSTDAQIALASVVDASDLNRELLSGGHSAIAGRLAGALRAIGKPEIADEVASTMRAAGYSVQEENPFAVPPPVLGMTRTPSPYVLRLELMWSSMREEVLHRMPSAPGLPHDVQAYLAQVAENYTADAYHSLSIEGYRVTDDLIARVASGAWNPEQNDGDKSDRNAMAAQGYWLAFQAVQKTLGRILNGDNPGDVARVDHGTWYRELFGPSVAAGILSAVDLAGYRNAPVFIKNAAHVPPSREVVREMMPTLFKLIAEEPSAAVRAVLGHFFFVFIHPYMDGNGRMGRFLMNALLASGGYPWTIIRVEWRDRYLTALDAASARGDIRPFAEFIADAVRTPPPQLSTKIS